MVVAVVAMTMFFNVNELTRTDVDLASILLINKANAEGDTYKGPLCGDSSGTKYCCKGSSGDCSAGAKCSSCQ